jgi:polysaccharide deacetylase family protein (PEP-CTERM system associated)
MTQIPHHLTIDVEEYFHVSAFERHLPRARWNEMESRLLLAMERLLGLMDDAGARGTFFVLGCVAERHPALVRRLARDGHEIASHGWDHRRVGQLTPLEFRTQARDTRALLEDLSGTPVTGYRAPSFSIVRGREWALEILVEEGYLYDSSLYPVRRPGYGYTGGAREISTLPLDAGTLIEVPPATLSLAGANLPLGGGGTFRHLPYMLTRATLREHERRGWPATFYLHPWELDPEQPRLPGLPRLTRLRHYGGLDRTEPRLLRLLAEHTFQPIAETLKKRVLQ